VTLKVNELQKENLEKGKEIEKLLLRKLDSDITNSYNDTSITIDNLKNMTNKYNNHYNQIDKSYKSKNYNDMSIISNINLTEKLKLHNNINDKSFIYFNNINNINSFFGSENGDSKLGKYNGIVSPLKCNANTMTEIYTIDIKEIEELNKLRNLHKEFKNEYTQINMKNVLITNLTIENEKLKSDINEFLVNENDFKIVINNNQNYVDDLNYYIQQQKTIHETIQKNKEIDTFDKIEKSETSPDILNVMSMQLSKAMQEN